MMRRVLTVLLLMTAVTALHAQDENEYRMEIGGGAGLVKFDCKAFVDGEIRAKGKLAFCAVDKANIYG